MGLAPHDASEWPAVITRVQGDQQFITAFAKLVAYREDLSENPFDTLCPQHAAELALALLRQFPPSEERRGSRRRAELPDDIERLRRTAIDMLAEAGTVESIRALEWLRDQEPRLDTLRYILIEARQKHADAAWRPLSLHELKTIVIADEGGTPKSRTSADVVPSVATTSPARRDAGRDEVVSLLGNISILVETATPTETAALHGAMKPLRGEQALVVGSAGFATYTLGMLGQYAVAHFQTDMGNESPNAAQLATNDAIVEARAKLLLQVGIAFGLQPAKQRLGDVLVAQHITSYEMVKLRPDSVGNGARRCAPTQRSLSECTRTGEPGSYHVLMVLQSRFMSVRCSRAPSLSITANFGTLSFVDSPRNRRRDGRHRRLRSSGAASRASTARQGDLRLGGWSEGRSCSTLCGIHCGRLRPTHT